MHPLEAQLATPVIKSYRAGTHRTVAPAATIARAGRVSPVLGITRVANVTGLDSIGLPVVMVVRPNGRSLSVSQGKGLTLDAARASGLMESIESYHAERILLPLKLASYEEIRYTHRVIDVGQLPLVGRNPFDPYQAILWIEGFDLIQHEPIWLPFDAVHCNYTIRERHLSSEVVCSSNGLASGNHLLEAIAHGLYEVLERDAQVLWQLQPRTKRTATRIALQTIHDPDCQWVLERFAQAGMATVVWDLTSDVGLPTFCCRIIDREADPIRPLFSAEGSGCHTSRAIALVRALTEAAQSRLTFIAGSRDDCFPADYQRVSSAKILERTRAIITAEGANRDFTTMPDWQSETFNRDIEQMLVALQQVGIARAVVVDLTRAELGIPVVKVVVPGLEDITASAAGWRGWRARTIQELRA